MSAELLLSKLDKVRRNGPGRYMACCPAHDDRLPSLSIKESDDGTVLVHCFAGCDVHSIVAAVGLELSDLFPPNESYGKRQRRPFPAADVLNAIGFEALVVAAAAKTMANGGALSAGDVDRLITASSRIQAGVAAAGGRHG